MGKTKQAKEKKFDRNVEISAPILDPEIIRKIHTPPKGQRLDIKHGGFKALLSDLNSQDSTDELTPLNDNHVPSYIGISCAVSGYSNYSSYSKRSTNSSPEPQQQLLNSDLKTISKNRSRTTSPTTNRQQNKNIFQHHHNQQEEIHHIKIDKNNVQSIDEERKELTEKLTASANERLRRSPSPITPTEDDRHHGAYVGARYCPLPPPSKLVNKHIPLLGIDDDLNPDELSDENNKENKVEQKIASLYGDNFVEDWRESMTHKAKKEFDENHHQQQNKQDDDSMMKCPKDLVTLKPTPNQQQKREYEIHDDVVIQTPNVKVLANVEKEFLNKLLTDENPPTPTNQSPIRSPSSPIAQTIQSTTIVNSSNITRTDSPTTKEIYDSQLKSQQSHPSSPVKKIEKPLSPELKPLTPEHVVEQQQQSPPMSPDSGKIQSSVHAEELIEIEPQESTQISGKEEHIEYQIRAESPLDNESSPIKVQNQDLSLSEAGEEFESNNFKPIKEEDEEELAVLAEKENIIPSPSSPVNLVTESVVENLVNFSPSPEPLLNLNNEQQHQQIKQDSTLIIEDNNQLIKTEDVDADQEEEQQQQQQVYEKEDQEEKPVNLIETVVSNEEQIFDSAATPDKKDNEQGEQKPQTVTTTTTNSDKVKNDGQYYLDLLEKEKSFILKQIEGAQEILREKESELDEDSLGRIHSAIGKANLLINKKFNQFKGLCETNCLNNNNENEGKEEQQQFAVLNDDLAGFWDMLSIQIIDVKRSFEIL